LRPHLTHEYFLRGIPGPEASVLLDGGATKFFSQRWTVGRRADRMGLQLEGALLALHGAPPMASSPVFPGAVQCPQDGTPFLLLADAQTVGGYPRIAQIIAADLPLTGQLRPGDHVWIRQTSPEEARDIARKKTALLSDFFAGGFYR
ncbi:MAG: allophanate hydrolase subunit 2 family protein, partial [Pseudomonadota bacterium]